MALLMVHDVLLRLTLHKAANVGCHTDVSCSITFDASSTQRGIGITWSRCTRNATVMQSAPAAAAAAVGTVHTVHAAAVAAPAAVSCSGAPQGPPTPHASEGTAQLTKDPAGSVLLLLPPANMVIRRSLPCSASPPNNGSHSGGHGVQVAVLVDGGGFSGCHPSLNLTLLCLTRLR